jgi:hypothetical protein
MRDSNENEQSGMKGGQTKPGGGKAMLATAQAVGQRQVEPARQGRNHDSSWWEI